MKFKLKESAKSLFIDCKSFQEKQQRLIDYGKWLTNELKRPLITSDFNVPGRISSSAIIVYFKNIKNYFNSFGKMDFKLLMPEIELFRGCDSQQEKYQRLIDYGKWLSGKLERSLVAGDFEVAGRISSPVIAKYFDGIKNYFNSLGKIDFKLLISTTELFRRCNSQGKRQRLIDYGNWLSKELGRPLVQSDFEVKGRVSYGTIKKYFGGSLTNYFNSCDFSSVKRKTNMSDAEMREFLKDKKKVAEKDCWITDYWKTSKPDGRILIMYKGKTQLLYRVSYALFKGSIPDGLLATHSCDNPRCYNPDHLVADTYKGNMKQAAKRGKLGGSTGNHRKHHGITDPYDYKALLNFVKQHIKITEKNEWIFLPSPSEVYPTIQIKNRRYRLHRLILANKLGKTYDEIDVACHRLPDGSKPDKRDVNPDHLFEDTLSGNALDTSKYNKSYKLDNDKANQVKDAAAKSDFSERGSKGRFDTEWAAKLDVSRSCITSIRLGTKWKPNNLQGLL